MESIVIDWVNYFLSKPFCCMIIFAPGLLVPVYRWLKSRLSKSR